MLQYNDCDLCCVSRQGMTRRRGKWCSLLPEGVQRRPTVDACNAICMSRRQNSPRPRPKRSEGPIRIPSIPHLLIPSPVTPTPQSGGRGGGGGVHINDFQWIWAVCAQLPLPPPPPLPPHGSDKFAHACVSLPPLHVYIDHDVLCPQMCANAQNWNFTQKLFDSAASR